MKCEEPVIHSLLKQPKRLATLKEYFPARFFNDDIVVTTYVISADEDSENEHLRNFNVDDVQGNEQIEVLMMLQSLLAQFSLHEALNFQNMFGLL